MVLVQAEAGGALAAPAGDSDGDRDGEAQVGLGHECGWRRREGWSLRWAGKLEGCRFGGGGSIFSSVFRGYVQGVCFDRRSADPVTG